MQKSSLPAKENRMSFYAVIDTNVLVSAFLKSTSVPHIVVDYVFAGDIVPLYNEEILAEYKDVLNRPKFHFPKEAVELTVNKIKEIGIHFDSIAVNENLPDPKEDTGRVRLEGGDLNRSSYAAEAVV